MTDSVIKHNQADHSTYVESLALLVWPKQKQSEKRKENDKFRTFLLCETFGCAGCLMGVSVLFEICDN